MSSKRDLQRVFMKDGEGNPYNIQQTVYQGRIINYAPGFSDPSYILENIHYMKSRKSDVWLITFPKSGTNWMYEILSILTSGELPPTKVPITERCIELKTTFERKEDEAIPTIHSTHLKADFMPQDVLKQQKIIYVVRNPKSVAASYFSHRTRSKAYEYRGTFFGFLPVFLEAPYPCIGTWFEHVIGYWTKLKNNPNVLFVFFEDLVKDPLKTIQQISSFLECSHSKEFCEKVVKLTNLENMKHVEQTRMAEFSKHYWKEGNAGFVRKGKIDDWKSHFTVEQNEYFDIIYESKIKDHIDIKQKIKFE